MLRRGHIECVWSGISVPVMNGASGISAEKTFVSHGRKVAARFDWPEAARSLTFLEIN